MMWIKKWVATAFIIFSALILGGCPGYPRYDENGRAGNYQTAAGINVVEFKELECSDAEIGLCGPTDFRMLGGKEQGNVSITMWHPETGNKVLEYTANDVKAFDGQQFRSEVEKALNAEIGDVSSKTVDSVVSAARKAITGL
jgi:hypothetical protein